MTLESRKPSDKYDTPANATHTTHTLFLSSTRKYFWDRTKALGLGGLLEWIGGLEVFFRDWPMVRAFRAYTVCVNTRTCSRMRAVALYDN
jgi:hypothetical protein